MPVGSRSSKSAVASTMACGPLRRLHPAADVPAFQVSLPARLDGESEWPLGAARAPLADEAVPIAGSGSLTNNLVECRPCKGSNEACVAESATWVGGAVVQGTAECGAKTSAERLLDPEVPNPVSTDDGVEDASRLAAFGEAIRALRARKGLTRKALAAGASLSERYLTNLEFGRANPSLLVLEQMARALGSSVAEITGDRTASSPEWLLMRELLDGRSEQELRHARLAVGEALGTGGDRRQQSRRVALVGLRGAGKSTLGSLLSECLELPFLELGREIERVAGMDIRTIYDLYGTPAYRRYERRALEEIVQIYPEAVIATPGGLVSDPATFNLLLGHCFTVWLRADPDDHMNRVIQQGDKRPMAGNEEAMEDLRRILAARSAFYAKADLCVDTSRQPLDETLTLLVASVSQRLALAG